MRVEVIHFRTFTIRDTDYFKLKIKQTSVPDVRSIFYADR